MGKLNVWPFILAAMLTTMFFYLLCVLFITFFGLRAVIFFGYMFHGIDLMKIVQIKLSFFPFFLGFIEVIIFTALLAFIFVEIYNLCLRHCINKGWIRED